MVDFGYDISDYKNVDQTFGTLSDFDELIKVAHTKGIKVVIDLVANHNPLPLLSQLTERRPGEFEVAYLEDGPEVWKLRLTRI